jgi:hypothetical protein
MSSHENPHIERNVSIGDQMKFCTALTSMVGSFERKKRQIKTFFNGVETSKGIMGLMVDLTSVGAMFNLRIEITGYESIEEGQKLAEEVIKKLEPSFA